MTRLRLGHSALNKSLKMIGKHETGLCEWCQEEESVEHIIIRCRRYEVQRVIMRILAQVRILLTFLRETGLFNRL